MSPCATGSTPLRSPPACLEAGLVVNVPGPGMLRFLPPLVIDAADVGKAIGILDESTR